MATLNTVTSSTRPASPAAGEAYFETDTNKIIIWDGSAWTELVSDTAPSFTNTYSLDFDGTNDYIDSGISTDYDISSGGSYSIWFNQANNTGSERLIVYASGTSSSWAPSYSAWGYSLYRYVNKLGIFWAAGGSQNSADQTFNAGWNHAVLTYDSTTAKVYLNGNTTPIVSVSATSGTSGSHKLYFGLGEDANTNFQGKLDEVAYFSSALSTSDITDIYNSGVPTDISSLNPVGYWRMGDNDSGTGTTITNQGSGGNDGTLVNGPTFSTDIPS
jgi:hypothetical protein